MVERRERRGRVERGGGKEVEDVWESLVGVGV